MVDKNSIHIFDRKLAAQRRERAAKNFSEYDFLFKWTKENLIERLEVVKRDFERIVQIGARGGPLIDGAITLDLNSAYNPDIIADEEFLPVAPQSCDMIVSALNLHSVNDLPGTLIQIKRALKPDGLFIAALFGGETLYELRECLSSTEMDLKGGLSPRVAPFADKQDAGALLQRAGFALPVVDSDIITVSYEHIFKLMHDLRGMGESNSINARDKRNPGRTFFFEAAKRYSEKYAEDDGRVKASFEIIFMLGWAPHESQQKPLRPGSAEHSLAEALGDKTS